MQLGALFVLDNSSMAYLTSWVFNAARAILLEEQLWYYLYWENKGVNIGPKGISLKINVVERLEFERV